MKMKQSSTVLGLTLDGGILNAVELKRTNESVRVVRQLKAPLTLDPLRDEPELAGREIRNLLNQGKISTKRCVAGAPAHWALTVHTKVPELDGEDLTSFLEIEAERGFACHVDELQTSSRIYRTEAGEQYATIIGVPRAYLERFQAVLEAAQLKPVSLSLGITALPEAELNVVTVEISDSRIDFLVRAPSGIAALRTIDSAFDSEGAERRIQAEVLARELRITLGQLPAEFRPAIRHLNIFGEHRFAEQLLSDFQTRARVLGLESRHITQYSQYHGVVVADGAPVSGACSLAVQYLSGGAEAYEFLPPKPTFWQELSGKYSSRRLAYTGAAAAILLLLIAAVFIYRQVQYSNYEEQWLGMKEKVEDLEKVQGKIRQFRAWHDTTLTTLNIMRRLTEAFPEEGIVSAKLIEIRDGNAISCMGTARDNASLLQTIDKLRASAQVRDLRVDQIRGNSPLQFTFNFHWNEAATHEN